MIEVKIHCERGRVRECALVRRSLERIFGGERMNASLEVCLAGDRRMREIQRRFFGSKKKDPDIFAFPEDEAFPHPERRRRHLGELYVNADLCRGKEGHLIFLAVHGALHLLGYDHARKGDMLKMERKEEKLLQKTGLTLHP